MDDSPSLWASCGEAWLGLMRHVWSSGTPADDDRGPVIEAPPVLAEISALAADDPIIERYGDAAKLALYTRKFTEDTVVAPFKYSYGARIRGQLQWAADLLTARPYSKSAWISLTLPGEPYDCVPCLTSLAFRIRERSLHMTAAFRSQNAYTCYLNYLPLADVQARMAGGLGLSRGPMRVFVDVPHLYLADLEPALRIMRPSPHRLC
jgi:thymidylate synthase